ncbi:MAG TPA: PKD domain-containing protein [Ignavibacteriaceae bacterium]|nr:PKD domain-containing protein [Ignavibacteriaceae bacterium]
MKKFFFVATALFFCLFQNLNAQKELRNRELEIIPDEKIESTTMNKKRVETITGKPVALYNVNYQVKPDTPELMARQFLLENSKLLKINYSLENILFKTVVETPAAYHVHFTQHINGYPVYNSDINVTIGRNNKVVFVMNGYKIAYGSKENLNLSPLNISKENALLSAKNYMGLNDQINFENVETIVYYNKGSFRLAQKVNIIPSAEKHGEWEILVDAGSGEIFRVEDKAYYYDGDDEKNKRTGVNGSGWVFDPDPITHATTTYGTTGFVDNNDADSDSLTAHLEVRDLIDITFNGTNYSLVSPWAQITDFESPFTGLHPSATSNFYYTRNSDNFEAVNVFYFVDQSMKYINQTLGITLMPHQYTGGVKFDPHGLSGDDNSHYISATGTISFGDGGVDDAEDISVIVHELGHGIHDWLTGGSLSQVEGLSEGCGDYWAVSYIRNTGYWTNANPAYNWVFIWDGHNPFWPGRITNYTAHYPEGLVGQVHTDGQMWASSLMSVYDLIGREPTDRNFLEGLAMTNGSSNQQDAANAFMQSDQLNYAGIHLTDIATVFVARGYIDAALTVDFTADVTGGQAPLTVQFTDLSNSINGPIISWEWDLDGDGDTDSNIQNPSWVYTTNGSFTVSLTASDGTETFTETKTGYISVNSGIFVWEGEANGPNYSGTFFKTSLEDSGYTVTYSTAPDLPSSMEGFDAAFLSFGNYGSSGTTYTELTDENASTIIDYLQSGGKVFLESSDAMGFDQDDNTTFLNLFGLASATDGSSGNHPITNLQGQSGALTSGITFTSTSQPQTAWIDIYTASANGTYAFNEPSVGNVAVQSAQGDARTFCFSYALGKLNNGVFPSTKENLLQEILDFFEVEPVPVELSSFNAVVSDNRIELVWETASEINNSGFELERNINNKKFEKITFISGHGTTTEKQIYSFIDKPNADGKISYRLKQIDFNGDINYSSTIEVNFNLPKEFSLSQNYPNPFNPTTKINYSLAVDSRVTLGIYNLLGQQVSLLVNKEMTAGKYDLDFDAGKLTSGTYFYRIEAVGKDGKSYTSTKKMLLVK